MAMMALTTHRLPIISGVLFALVLISTITHFSLRPSPLDLSDPNHFHFTADNYRLCKERFNCPTLEDWLHSEAEASHELAVKGLLKAGADINARVDDGTAALHVAVFKGSYNVVKLLLKSPVVDINVRTIEPKTGWHDMFSPPPIRWTALHIAAIQGDEKILKLLLHNKADITATSIEGYTALHRAAEFGKDKITKILIAGGAGVDARSVMGGTPLIDAANGGYGIPDEQYLKVVDILLSARANVNAEMYDGRSAMWVAVNRRHPKIVEILLKAGASLTSSFDGVSTMQRALENGDFDILEMLFLAGAELPRTEKGMQSAKWQFIMAADKERVKLVELFLKAGVDVNSVDWQYTALSCSAGRGNKGLVEMLLAAGADIDLRAEHGNTGLYQAASNGHGSVVEALLKSGAEIGALSQKDFTALHGAAANGHHKVCEFLLAASADINAKSIDGETPLHLAAQNGSSLLADTLFANHADVTSRTTLGKTPLHYAAEADQPQFVEKLIHPGNSDPNAQSTTGFTPLHLSAPLRAANVTLILLSAHAIPNLKSHNGTTALSIAVRNHRSATVEALLGAGAEIGPEGLGKISLWEASGHEYFRILEELLKEKTIDEVNEVVHFQLGWTCLHSAAYYGRKRVAEMLLGAGADKGIRASNGQTARELAIVRGFQDVADLLS
jgi:ankyrin repeat protein